MPVIALQMYTLRKHMGSKEELRETLGRVAAIGYQAVQITPPGFVTLPELRQMLDETGLYADSVLAHSTKLDEEYDDVLRAADILSTGVVRLDGISHELAQSEEGYHTYAAMLERGGQRFRAAGLSMYYHFHAFEWVNFPDGRRGIDILLDETSPEAVGFQPDIYWLAAAGTEPSDSLRRFAGRARYMHVKDYGITLRSGAMENVPRTFAAVGKGNLNLPAIVRTAREIGIEEYCVEQDECSGDVFACIEESYKGLKTLGI